MTSVGALTATFTPSAHCASSTGIYIVGCGTGCVWWAEGPLSAPDCYPNNYNPSLSHYYSPGICPSGYTPGCTSHNTVASLTETIYTCCPTALGYTYGCVGTPQWPWQSSLGCTVYFSDSTSTFDFPTVTFVQNGQSTQTSTARTEVEIHAYGVEVRFQSQDFASVTNTVSSTESTGTTKSSELTQTSTGIGTGSSQGSGPGLSSGAAAGIGVGSAAVVALLVGLGVYAIRKRRKPRQENTPQYSSPGFESSLAAPTYYNAMPADNTYKAELPSTGPTHHELPSESRGAPPAELGS